MVSMHAFNDEARLGREAADLKQRLNGRRSLFLGVQMFYQTAIRSQDRPANQIIPNKSHALDARLCKSRND